LWLHYLRTGESAIDRGRELQISALRDTFVEVRLRSSGSDALHALIDSGFGYSQVLPVVVSCLLADQGETVLIEQPELHLNPALQVRLADFFLAVVRNRRQVILETHSEHLVNALRVLAVEDETGQFHDQVGLTYLDDSLGALRKIDLHIQADGTVADWPSHFFGEALTLSARLLAAQKRALRRNT
jgi:predicted ATPase